MMGLLAIGGSKLLSLPGVMDGIKEFMKKVVVGVSDLIQKGVQLLSGLLKDNEVINSISKVIKSVFLFIADGISGAADFFKNIITDPANKDSIGKIVVSVIGTVFNGLLAAFDIAGKALSDNKDSIKEGIVTVFVKIAEALAGVVGFASELVKSPEFSQAIADIWLKLKEFIGDILNIEIPLGDFGTVTLGTAFATVAGAMVAFEVAMAALTGYILTKVVGGALGKGAQAAGNVAGAAGAAGGGKKGVLGKVAGALSSPTTTAVLGTAAVGITAAKSMGGGKETSTSPVKAGTEGPATTAQKASAVSAAKSFAGKSGADFVSSMEGFAGKAYLDPPNNTKNQYSIGYGHLITEAEVKQGFINLGNGKKIDVKGPGGKDTVISKEEAKELLNSDIPKYEAIAANALGSEAWSKLNQDQRNALVSLAYNGGAGQINYLIKHGLRDAILKGDIDGASKIIYEKGWKTSGGKQLAGLDTRRLKEATLFAGSSSQAPSQMAAAPTPAQTPAGGEQKMPDAPPVASTSPTMNQNASATGDAAKKGSSKGSEKDKSFGQKMMDLLASEGGDFMKQLDEMTGGKLGFASGDLAQALRTRNISETGDTIDGSTNITGDTSTNSTQPLPSIYDDALLSKISVV